jgi:rod shape-determining protein MreC
VSAFQEPFFTRGPSPLARLTFFSLVAVGIMIADHRFQAMSFVRMGVSAVLTPIEQVLAMPGNALSRIGTYFSDQHQLISENRALNQKVLDLAAEGQQAKLVLAEKTYVEALGSAHQRFVAKNNQIGITAEVIRDARNPYSRKIIVNKGVTHGVTAGLAVIGGDGVVGQVTAVGLTSSEVTLSTEKDQSIPVMIVRNGLRAIAVGSGREGAIELPYIPINSDVQSGDQLVTSGIDGTYPPGLSVGVISQIEKNPAFPFARIVVQPVQSAAHHRFVNVMLRDPAAAYPKSDVGKEDKRALPPREPARADAGKATVPADPGPPRAAAAAAATEKGRSTQ